MTAYPFYQIDAFASRPFEGNQACVMPMQAFLADETLQAIAAENNVAETAFIVADRPGRWQLRWFTPAVEVPLCGHATLAAAHALFAHLGFEGDEIVFETRQSGELRVARVGEGYEMDFPASPIEEVTVSDEIAAALGARPSRAFVGSFYAAEFDSPGAIHTLQPDQKALATLGAEGGGWARGNFGCFALGGSDGAGLTSRFFAPGSGIDEDPATGSWHCMLAPIAHVLTGKAEFACHQAYPGRGARIGTRLEGNRVKLIGKAVTVIDGQFRL